jgi:hypothetical protein
MTCDSARLRFLAEYEGDTSALLEGVTCLEELRERVDREERRRFVVMMQEEQQGSRATYQEMAVI